MPSLEHRFTTQQEGQVEHRTEQEVLQSREGVVREVIVEVRLQAKVELPIQAEEEAVWGSCRIWRLWHCNCKSIFVIHAVLCYPSLPKLS